MKCAHECLYIFLQNNSADKKSPQNAGLLCLLQAELWPGPANPQEQVGGCATAQHKWLSLVPAEVVCCFSLSGASPIASLDGTGTEPWGLWWNPRPPRAFHTASCSEQCPLSPPLEKGCSTPSCPGGLSPGLAIPLPIPAFSCSPGVSVSRVLYTPSTL